jgi:catechol 2,3-dioxygenase-like lactoylglutathione lyase family enzyme
MQDGQLIEGVDFVAVPTGDLERAVEFYGTTLGLPRSVYIKERHYAEFETSNLTLSVIDAERMGIECEPADPPPPLRPAREPRADGDSRRLTSAWRALSALRGAARPDR